MSRRKSYVKLVEEVCHYSWSGLRNFIPKISNFGLTKLYPTSNNIVNLTVFDETIGYIAPELISRSIGAISYKYDVYNFGVLLMEMLDLERNEIQDEEDSANIFLIIFMIGLTRGKILWWVKKQMMMKRRWL
ncbi:hypothetical protein RDI58_029093 [Solanum bulbocastanum]|uniref:Protein kinase domain-containing protein n=1 Tax=Solanum bulbocastanum TaxID=147425 RepID=A0AAN8STJ4_SOLBU